jgi:hypothetical protein
MIHFFHSISQSVHFELWEEAVGEGAIFRGMVKQWCRNRVPILPQFHEICAISVEKKSIIVAPPKFSKKVI